MTIQQDTVLTLRELRNIPPELADALGNLQSKRVEYAQVRERQWATQVAFDAALNAATMAAYAGGTITGKNQAERDVQLAQTLNGDTDLGQAALSKTDAERAVMNAELAEQGAEGTVKSLIYRLQAAQSAAALQAQLLAYEIAGQEQRATSLPPQLVTQKRSDDGLFR
jgi:hypothetical protein